MFKSLPFLVAVLSVFSMVTQPLAYGQEKANWAAQALKEYVAQNQKFGKPLTIKEFWEKNKTKLHPDWQRTFFPGIEVQKDERLPQMDVISVKGPRGQDTARLVITLANKKTVSIEILGGQEKFARINNQTISYAEFYSGAGLIEKLEEDSVFQGEKERVQALRLKASLVPSRATLRAMTPRERAEYFVNMRLMLKSAYEVLDINRKNQMNSESKESAGVYNLFLSKAYAADAKKPAPKSTVPSKDTKNFSPGDCIVAGYVGSYQRYPNGDEYCDHTIGISEARVYGTGRANSQNIVKKIDNLSSSCSGGGNQVACNPFVYGFKNASTPYCVTYSRDKGSDFQVATRKCGEESPLRKEHAVADTEKLINSMLLAEKNIGINEASVADIEKMAADFNTYIDAASGVCGDMNTAGMPSGRKHETKQSDACQVLKERRLAFQMGIATVTGKYAKPTPTPALPPPVPPVPPAPPNPPPVVGEKCQKAGDACTFKANENNGSLQAHDNIATDGRGVCDAELHCGPLVPPPLTVKRDNICDPLSPGFAGSGAPECVGTAEKLKTTAADKPAKKKKDNDWGFLLPLTIFGLGIAAAYYFTKPKKTGPVNYVPPAPPSPFTPIPQPQPITPVPPIVPTLPIPAPATGETPITAPSGGPAAGGTR